MSWHFDKVSVKKKEKNVHPSHQQLTATRDKNATTRTVVVVGGWLVGRKRRTNWICKWKSFPTKRHRSCHGHLSPLILPVSAVHPSRIHSSLERHSCGWSVLVCWQMEQNQIVEQNLACEWHRDGSIATHSNNGTKSNGPSSSVWMSPRIALASTRSEQIDRQEMNSLLCLRSVSVEWIVNYCRFGSSAVFGHKNSSSLSISLSNNIIIINRINSINWSHIDSYSFPVSR